MFIANEAPGTADQSDAYYKRWVVLPMDRKIAKDEQDPDILAKLTTPEELAGLLKYAVASLKTLWQRGRFEIPEPMAAAAEKYRSDTDTVIGFVQGRCALEPDGLERVGTLYEDYGKWCLDNGRQKLGMQRFREHLLATHRGKLGFKLRHHGYPTIAGIRLRTGTEEVES